APSPEPRLLADVDEQPDDCRCGERDREPVGDEADEQRERDGAQMEDDEASRSKVAQAHVRTPSAFVASAASPVGRGARSPNGGAAPQASNECAGPRPRGAAA